MLKPSSFLVSILLETRYLRIAGSRIVKTYVTAVPGGIRLRVRTWDTSEEYMVDEVFNRRIYEADCAIAPGNMVVDVGANIGAFSIKAAKVVGAEGQVLALEPESTNFALLTKNIRLNNTSNVFAKKIAVGERKDDTKLYVYGKRGNNSVFLRPSEKFEGVEHVEMDTLDGIIRERSLGRVDFLKIDVEGTELDVLRGGRQCINEFKPRIALETHSWGPSAQELIRTIRDCGYQSIRHVPTHGGFGMLYAS